VIPRQQSHIPDIFTHVDNVYTEECRKCGVTPNRAGLLKFAHAYLDRHRPVEMFAADANFGAVLNNNFRVLLCPQADTHAGDVNTGGSVAVTSGGGPVYDHNYRDPNAIPVT
jgi:hypothetical protein